jgi:hypothetical protein
MTNQHFQYLRRYFVGVDLGQSFDPTAIAICERITGVPWPGYEDEKRPEPEYNVRHLERLPLGTPYPAQIEHVLGLLCREPLLSGETRTYIDHTGVGRAVFDMFRAAHIRRLYGVTITAGNEVTRTDIGWHVPKLELISRVQALLHSKRLAIDETLPDAKALVSELHNFRSTFTSAGNVIFNARSGAHDDLVLALALAIFGATDRASRVSVAIDDPFTTSGAVRWKEL